MKQKKIVSVEFNTYLCISLHHSCQRYSNNNVLHQRARQLLNSTFVKKLMLEKKNIWKFHVYMKFQYTIFLCYIAGNQMELSLEIQAGYFYWKTR